MSPLWQAVIVGCCMLVTVAGFLALFRLTSSLDAKRVEQFLQVGRFGVTAYVTIVLVGVFAWGFIVKNIDNQVFTSVVISVVSFWFGAAVTGMRMMAQSVVSTTTTETDPSGAKREVTISTPPGVAVPTPAISAKPLAPEPGKEATG